MTNHIGLFNFDCHLNTSGPNFTITNMLFSDPLIDYYEDYLEIQAIRSTSYASGLLAYHYNFIPQFSYPVANTPASCSQPRKQPNLL